MHRSRGILAGLALSGCLLAGGCASAPPPLEDTITRIPVSNKADLATGIEMEYFMGSQQGYWRDVACGADRTCWYSGQAVFVSGGDARTNPVVAKMSAGNQVAWARTYEIDKNYTETFGLVPTADGGALMFGTTVAGSHWMGNRRFAPTYEKLGADGLPQWGGLANIAGATEDSAFQDAAPLADGGFVLVGSGRVGGDWRGVVLRIDATGHEVWALNLHSRDESTGITAVTQLADGDILAAGVNDKLRDMVLFDISPDGAVKSSPVVDIRGEQVPLWFAKTSAGPALIVSEKMPSGEISASVIRFDPKGEIRAASRYRFTDGFNPYGLAALPDGRLCVYGVSAAKDSKQSLALTINADTLPAAALSMDGSGVFLAGTALDAGHILLAGGRPLGVDQRASGVVVTWDPSLHVDPPLLAKFQREPVTIAVHKEEDATAGFDKGIVRLLKPAQMQSRLVSAPAGTSAPDAQGIPPG